jgi:hypothetical protein
MEKRLKEKREKLTMKDESKPTGVCIFCFKNESNKTPWCPDNPGNGCQYGLGHEYIESTAEVKARAKQAPKIDVNRCVHCGLHNKNPLSKTNGCEHMYPAA